MEAKAVKKSELELDHHFWNRISADRLFFDWFVARSKFAGSRLDHDLAEKWHQRWYRDPISKLDSETDITLFLVETRIAERYTIHIENKPPHGKWQPGQADNYARRGEDRMHKWQHQDFDTALIAPLSFIEREASEVAKFGFVITYEELALFIPEFGIA
jgi:hypothetical protein